MKNGQWRNGILGLLVFWTTVLLWPAAAGAQDDLTQLQAELEAQKQKQAELQDRINQLEARQRLKEKALNEKIDEVSARATEERAAEIPDVLKWASKLRWSGDFRYRYEYIDQRERDVRHRNRIRARLGLDAEVNEEWNLGFRLATGDSDPVSTNQTLDDWSSKKDVWLDKAFLGYHPNWIEGLNVLAGKIGNPWYKPAKNELIWDGDLTPEGAAFLYGVPLGDQTAVNVVGGGFWVEERSSDADTSLWGIQAYVKHQLAEPTHVLAGASWYDYGNIETESDFDGFFGNTSVGGVYAGDYDLFEVFGEFGTEIGGMPILFFGDYVQNTAVADEDTGWLIGAQINKAKNPGSWQFEVDYRNLERDAVVGQFTSSDFLGGGTGGEGYRFAFGYALAKNVAANLTYYMNEFDERNSDVDYDRLMADIVLKF